MGGSSTTISLINESSVVSDIDLKAAVAALQKQVSEHFAPVWGIDASLVLVPTGTTPQAGSWWLVIFDNTDQAGALGYHDLTEAGLPLGKVFAGTDLQYKQHWTVTASHELLEMLGDPNINLVAYVEPGPNASAMRLYAYEVADACESDDLGYQIDGVLVSDFVYPSWFESFWSSSTSPAPQFDYQKKITAPFQLLPGGYIGIYDVGSGQGWTQLTAEKSPVLYSSRPHVGSRRERRRTPRTSWQRSQRQSLRRRMLLKRQAFSLQAVSDERQGLRVQVAKDRAQRYSDYLQQIQNPTEHAGTGARFSNLAIPAAGRQLRILAEGDSWFEYPLPVRLLEPSGDGVIYQLQKLLGYPILNMAHHGEEVRQVLSLPQRQEIVQRLSDPNIRYDAMLFSGGGDDLVGDQFCIWLQDGPLTMPPTQLLNSAAISAAFDLLEAEFRELIRIRDLYSQETIIFVNCYDFPPITGTGVCGIGPWLKPSLDFQYHRLGVATPDPNLEFQIVQAFLTAFSAKLKSIATSAGVQRFIVVPTQGSLLANATDWQNEIHPSPGGFMKIAQKFQAALSTTFP